MPDREEIDLRGMKRIAIITGNEAEAIIKAHRFFNSHCWIDRSTTDLAIVELWVDNEEDKI